MSLSHEREISIDVVSDVVCPWCLIGVRRLDDALAALPEVKANVTYHPFLLDPTTPDAGVDLREHLRKKFGGDPDAMFGRVEAAARDAGIPLDFSKVRRSISTIRPHTILRHAIAKGTQIALKHALLDAYFLEGKDVSDPDVLAAIAAKHGFRVDEAKAIAVDPKELAETRAEASEASAQGISGVPFFIFDQRLALSGAQPLEVFKQAIARALSEKATA